MKKPCIVSNSTKNTSLTKSVVSFVSLLCLTMISLVAFMGITFGWFSENDKTTSSGMDTSLKDFDVNIVYSYKTSSMTEYAPLTADTNIFSGLFPADTISLKAIYTNNTKEAYTADVYLTPGDEGETPIIKDYNEDGTNEYYYLGSQIKITSITSTDSGSPAYNTGAFLVTESTDTKFASHASAQTVTDTEVAKGLSLPSSGTLEITITLEFINYESINQNAYQSFGASEGKCNRYILTKFS